MALMLASDSPEKLSTCMFAGGLAITGKQKSKEQAAAALRPHPTTRKWCASSEPEKNQIHVSDWVFRQKRNRAAGFEPTTPTMRKWCAPSLDPATPTVPMTQRRMLRHNAIEAWGTMQKTGWVRCRPPVR